MIRVPAEFEAKLLEYAHTLDQEGIVYSESELDTAIKDVLQGSRLSKSDRIFAGRLFDRLRQHLIRPSKLGGDA